MNGDIERLPQLEHIRASLRGARLGVFAIDTGSGRRIGIDEGSRYAMCSTFKLPLAAFVLWLSDRSSLTLGELLPFRPGDPLVNSPVSAANIHAGKLPIGILSAAIIQQSDNSAANMLLRRVGGPAALTRFIRACGDRVTRLDRFEMALNSNSPGDPRDTTTPAAMAVLTRNLLFEPILSQPSRERLAGWLKSSVPKPDRLRAGTPAGWTIGHKPGTGANGAVNDVGILWPPSGAAIVVASYISGGTASEQERAAAHMQIARAVVSTFG